MAREAREKALSVNERDFLLQALREEKRVDGRYARPPRTPRWRRLTHAPSGARTTCAC